MEEMCHGFVAFYPLVPGMVTACTSGYPKQPGVGFCGKGFAYAYAREENYDIALPETLQDVGWDYNSSGKHHDSV